MREKRNQYQHGAARLFAGLSAVLFLFPGAPAQQPEFGQGFSHPGQAAPASPAENAAYSAAVNQPNPEARVSAIQQFLVQYPNSSLRQPAIAQMMLAKRQANGPGVPAQPMNQSMSRPMMQPVNVGAPTAALATVPVVTPQPATTPRDSLLQHPAKPAEVAVVPGSLTIKADNSSLSQILDQVSRSTGMKVEGLGQDERIFGSYGPGDPREVLLTLLEGSGYNVLMVGDDKGAPRELSLSRRTASSTVASAAPARYAREQEDDEIEQEPPPPEQPQPVVQTPPANPDGAQPKNPAEIQQELIRLRQQQQQTPQPQ